MPRQAGTSDGSVYFDVTNDCWIASIKLSDGRRRTRRGKTKTDAKNKLKALRRERDDGLIVARNCTVTQWLDEWLREIAPKRCAASTLDRYRCAIKVWIEPNIGRHKLGDLEPRHLRQLYDLMESSGRAKGTQMQVHAVMRRALEVALRERLVHRNVARLVDSPGTAKQETSALSAKDARKVLDAAKATGDFERWLVALALGVRQGEALGIAWENVDLDGHTIRIPWQLRRGRPRHGCGDPAPGIRRSRNGTVREVDVWPCGKAQPIRCPEAIGEKGLGLYRVKSKKSERIVVLPEVVVDALRALRRRQNEARLLAGKTWTGFTATPPGEKKPRQIGLVFCGPKGQPLDPRRDNATWCALLAEAGVPEVRLHDARHTAATILRSLGVPMEVVAEILGHSSTTVTQRYSHLGQTAPELADAAAKMHTIFG